ncbi:cytochrome C assembly family protein [Candidatus Williamhamiltonella defendens]|uniref:cytochrome C assembly family protein n=1 Tax=Candidatus Williamhamiltonella defendens TaxID=138072 RepID=UPI00158248F9|nr:cytochrome c biogenesis protein CcsA [Candidatus Hamiltonella defensa]
MSIFSIIALTAYSFSLSLIVPSLLGRNSNYRRWALVFAISALFCHAVALKYQIFNVHSGQNLSLMNICSIISILVCFMMTLTAFPGRGWFFLPIVYSFDMVNIIFSNFMPGEFIIHLSLNTTLFFHLGLAFFAYSTLIIAMLYALQLVFLDYLLKHKKINFISDMPPLMNIERHVFHITQIGTLLLTLTLLSGLFYKDNLFDRVNIEKGIFSIMAWCVYILLLWGHYRSGLRGRPALWLSFIGAFLLTLAYSGHRLTSSF